MYPLSRVTLRRNLFPCYESLKPLNSLLRFQKTKAIPESESHESRDSASHSGVRPFEDIPGPKRNLKTMAEFYIKSERFTKGYKLSDEMFERYGPIFMENMIMGTMVHLIDPDDHEKVLRAEGKYPSRPMVDFWLEHRQRRNYFPGILLL